MVTLIEQLAGRFWSKVARAGPDDCWEWQAKLRWDGYGLFSVAGRKFKATHVALELDARPRPPNGLALHSCDNRGCCNPRHLRWGTHQDNSDDMLARGRFSRIGGKRGEDHFNALLTEHDVGLIRRSSLGYKALAREYGVERSTIRAVKRRETWRHVP